MGVGDPHPTERSSVYNYASRRDMCLCGPPLPSPGILQHKRRVCVLQAAERFVVVCSLIYDALLTPVRLSSSGTLILRIILTTQNLYKLSSVVR